MPASAAATTIERELTFDFDGLDYTGILQFIPGDALLVMFDQEGPEVFSVDLSVYGLLPDLGNAFIKDWSEHQGLTRALEKAGLVRSVRTVTVGPFKSTAHEVEVTL